MHSDLVELGWTEDQWNRITAAVTEEAQKARVAAQMLPLVGPEDPTTVAIPPFTLNTARPNPRDGLGRAPPPSDLSVNSDPDTVSHADRGQRPSALRGKRPTRI